MTSIAVLLEQPGDAAGERLDDLLAALADRAEVDLGLADRDAELAGVADLLQDVGRRAAPPWPGCTRSSGSARRPSSFSTTAVFMPELRGPDRGDVAAGTGADDDAVVRGLSHGALEHTRSRVARRRPLGHLDAAPWRGRASRTASRRGRSRRGRARPRARSTRRAARATKTTIVRPSSDLEAEHRPVARAATCPPAATSMTPRSSDGRRRRVVALDLDADGAATRLASARTSATIAATVSAPRALAGLERLELARIASLRASLRRVAAVAPRVARAAVGRARAAGAAAASALRRRRACGYAAHRRLRRSRRAARARRASGSAASAIARTTTIAPRAGGDDRGDVGRVDPADREPRHAAARRRPRGGRGRARRPGGRAWSASRAPGRRRRSRRRARGVDLLGRVRRAPDEPRPAPASARASATGMSSWPTCTPSAPAARARSGRSLRMNSAPRVGAQRAAPSAAAARSSSSARVLVAQLEDVDAAAQRRREDVAERPPAGRGRRRGRGARRGARGARCACTAAVSQAAGRLPVVGTGARDAG